MTDATYFGVGYVILVPWITSTYCAYAKIVDDQEDGGSTSVTGWVLLGICIAHTVALMGATAIFMSNEAGIAILVFSLFVVYMIAQFIIYKRNEFNMPLVWQIINSILMSVVFIGVLYTGVHFPQFSSYTAVTMTVWTAIIIVGLSAAVLFGRDEAQHLKDPVFYSPWLLPIYKYNSGKNDIDTHKTPTVMLLSCCLTVLFWGIFTCVCIKPVWIGVCITIIAEIAIIQLSIYLIYSGSAHRQSVEDFIDELVVK